MKPDGWQPTRARPRLGLFGYAKVTMVASLLFVACTVANAHISSNGFLSLRVSGQHIDGTFELAVRDAELAVGLDANHDGKITWKEAQAAEHELRSYLQQHFIIAVGNGNAGGNGNGSGSGSGRCPLTAAPMQVNERVDGNYLWLPFSAHCAGDTQRLLMRYTVLADIDPSHRGLLTLTAGSIVQTGVLGGDAEVHSFAVNQFSRWGAFLEYARAGMLHIWSGPDHLLFLMSLLLPAVLIRRQNRWEPVDGAWPAFVGVLQVVTAFTLAHSVTLSLAALDILRLPTRLTESLIALSIAVAALNNVFPLVTETRWRIAFAFGLLHGFSFASVLADMGLPSNARLISLVGFNSGVEVGQLVVVAGIMPFAYLIRAAPIYRRGLMPWGSLVVVGLALMWLVKRGLMPTG